MEDDPVRNPRLHVLAGNLMCDAAANVALLVIVRRSTGSGWRT